jgi:hypothetical protein
MSNTNTYGFPLIASVVNIYGLEISYFLSPNLFCSEIENMRLKKYDIINQNPYASYSLSYIVLLTV